MILQAYMSDALQLFPADGATADGMIADSVVVADAPPFVADSLTGLVDSLRSSVFLTDSLHIPEPVDPVVEVFGSASYRVADTAAPVASETSFTSDIPFQIAVVALLLLFFYVMLRYRVEAAQLLRLMFERKKEGRSVDDYQSVLSGFVNAMLALFVFSYGIAATRAVDMLTGGGAEVALPAGVAGSPVLISLVVVMVMTLVGVAQALVLRLAGSVVFEGSFVKRLLWQRNIFMATLTVFVAPLAILMGLSPEPWCVWAAYGILGVSALTLVWAAGRSFRLFVGQKVSILFWILYLCAVELMPWCIVVLATLRGVAS